MEQPSHLSQKEAEATVPFTDESRQLLAERVRARDPAALQAVVKTYLPQVLRAARGAGLAPARAEDVTQATFTTFLERAEEFEGRSHVRTWLFGILYKKIAGARREARRDEQMADIDGVVEQRFNATGSWVNPPRPIEGEVYAAEVRERLTECLDAVPTQQRMAFVLREVEGCTTEELCTILQVMRTNLGVLLHRVRHHLRECLEAKGVRG
jgi:RNA polymerase sigma-70 factor, ECF subfamily